MDYTITEHNGRVRSYSDLMGRSITEWGAAIYKGRRINIYTDKQLAHDMIIVPVSYSLDTRNQILEKIGVDRDYLYADLGGADGFIAQQVHLHYSSLVSHRRTLQVASVDNNPSSVEQLVCLKQEGRRSDRIIDIESDLLELPYSQVITHGSLDAASMRFTLPYFSLEEQPDLLNSIYNSMGIGAKLIIFSDGVETREQNRMANHMFQEINRVFRPYSNNFYPSLEEMADMAQNVGFSLERCHNASLEIEAWLSAQQYASRFDIDFQTQKILNEMICSLGKKTGLQMIDKGGQYFIRRPLAQIILIRGEN